MKIQIEPTEWTPFEMDSLPEYNKKLCVVVSGDDDIDPWLAFCVASPYENTHGNIKLTLINPTPGQEDILQQYDPILWRYV